MGNRFSRWRDAPAVTPEQKTEAGPARTDQDQNPELTQTQDSVQTEKLMADESGTTEACSPKRECVSGSEEVEGPVALVPQNDAESTVKEAPPPVQTEPLIPAMEPPEHEGFAQPALVAEAQLALKPEPESSSHQEAEAELISEPAPTTAPLEQPMYPLNREPLPPLIDFSVPDVASAPASIPASLSPGESWNISAAEQREGRVEPAGATSLEPETSAFVEKQTEVEAAGCMKTSGSEVVDENFFDDLKNLDLEGNDLLNDLIQSEVKMPDDTPFRDVSASIELM